MNKKIIVSIPAYNEERTVGKTIQDIKRVMKSYNYKILVIDDGSKDKTAEIAKKNGAIVYSHPKNYGLAETFRTEIEKALKIGFDIFVHTDADAQYPAEYIPKLIECMEKGNDLVLGSRFKGKIEHMSLIKKIGNITFSKIISNIIKYKITDCQTGFRAFTNEIARKIKIISNHTYTQEQIIKAVMQKFKVKEIPVYFAKRKGSKSRLIKNPFEYALKSWINLIRIYRDYSPLKFFGIIGGLFSLIGILIGFWLFSIFLSKGSIGGHVPAAILSMLLILFGFQIISFGFLADMKR